jgi:hypothetical protein
VEAESFCRSCTKIYSRTYGGNLLGAYLVQFAEIDGEEKKMKVAFDKPFHQKKVKP